MNSRFQIVTALGLALFLTACNPSSEEKTAAPGGPAAPPPTAIEQPDGHVPRGPVLPVPNLPVDVEPISNPSSDVLTWNQYENRSVLLLISVGIGKNPVRGQVLSYQATDFAHSYQVRLSDGLVHVFSRSEIAVTEGCSVQNICVGQKVFYATQKINGEMRNYREAVIIGYHYGARELVQYALRYLGDDGKIVHRASVRAPDFLSLETREVLLETDNDFKKAVFLGPDREPDTFRLSLEDGTETAVTREKIVETKGCSEERICIGDAFYNLERDNSIVSIKGLQTTNKGYSRYLIYFEDGPSRGRLGSNWGSVDLVSTKGRRTSVTGARFTVLRDFQGVPFATQDPTGLMWVPVQMGKEFTYDEYGYSQVRQYNRESAIAACSVFGGRLPFFKELEKLEEFFGGRSRTASFYSATDGRTPLIPGLEHYSRVMLWANAFETPSYSTTINGGDLLTADVESTAFDLSDGQQFFGEYTFLSLNYTGQGGRGKDSHPLGSLMCVIGEPKQEVFGGQKASTDAVSLQGLTCPAQSMLGEWERKKIVCSNQRRSTAWVPQKSSLTLAAGPRDPNTQVAAKNFSFERDSEFTQSPDKVLDMTPQPTGGCELSVTLSDRRDHYGQIAYDPGSDSLILEPDSTVWNYFCHGMSEEGLRQQIIFKRKK